MRIHPFLVALPAAAALAFAPGVASAATKTCAKDGVCFTKTSKGATITITVTGTAGNDKIVLSNLGTTGNNNLPTIGVYDLAKHSVIRLAQAQAHELRPHNVAAVALTPGFLRSEAVLEHFNTTEDEWRATTDPHFARSESPAYLGRAVAALAQDPRILEKSGRALATAPLAREFGFTDADGTRPDFEAYWAESLEREYGPLGEPIS